jgi:uncharacterized membrane protein
MMKFTIRIYVFFTVLVLFWCTGIIIAPLLKFAGYTQVADLLYSFFSRVCHQEYTHSFHIEGEKLGVCVRCTSIYFGFLSGLLLAPLFGILKKKRMPDRSLLFVFILPMIVDVVLNELGLIESTAVTRMITGAIAGFAITLWILPQFIEACKQLLRNKKNRLLIYGVYPYVRKTR